MGKKPLFLAAFAFLALRNGLGMVSHAPVYLISLQVFEGVAAAIHRVLPTLVAPRRVVRADSTFSGARSSRQWSQVGFLSNLGFGALAKAGFNASFLALAVAALAGGVLF